MSPSGRSGRALVARCDQILRGDPARTLARLFVPGHEFVQGESRATGVLARILALSDEEVDVMLAHVLADYSGRHRNLPGILRSHYAQIAHRIPAGPALSPERSSLLGAYFTQEFSLEGAALCNPSVVAHPDQTGVRPGGCRFLLSLRAIGEGHLSSVEFRTGVLGPGDELQIDDAGPFVTLGAVGPTWWDRELFRSRLAEQGADAESSRFLLSCLPPRFTATELEGALSDLAGQQVTRQGGARTEELARRIAGGSYEVQFAPETPVAERALWPHAPAESHGIEDVRFVRWRGGDGKVVYRATCTAYDGAHIEPQVIETADFLRFRVSQLAGAAAKDKGMALFPRLIAGRHAALSRWDRESNAIAFSPDGLCWGDAQTLHGPSQPWELIQTGNSGSPIETEAGWLMLTHGVGPMREYAIGAMLLDLEDPTKVIGALRESLLQPTAEERDGYVPNVVYSCGSMLVGDRLLLPFGASDQSVRFALVDVPMLLELLTTGGLPSATRVNSPA